MWNSHSQGRQILADYTPLEHRVRSNCNKVRQPITFHVTIGWVDTDKIRWLRLVGMKLLKYNVNTNLVVINIQTNTHFAYIKSFELNFYCQYIWYTSLAIQVCEPVYLQLQYNILLWFTKIKISQRKLNNNIVTITQSVWH